MALTIRCFIVGTSLLFLMAKALAAPNAADLLTACEDALANGFQGVKGEMCTWYVTPCDCHLGKPEEMPRVCLPRSVPVETLAREVIAGLQDNPELKTKDAEVAAALILSRIYPCSEGQ